MIRLLKRSLTRVVVLSPSCTLLIQAEAKHIAACETLISSTTGSEGIVDAVRAAFTEKEELVHAEATARAILEKNRVAKEFDGKLQALVNRKADEENKAYKALIDAVYTDVLETVATDKKFQKVRERTPALLTRHIHRRKLGTHNPTRTRATCARIRCSHVRVCVLLCTTVDVCCLLLLRYVGCAEVRAHGNLHA